MQTDLTGFFEELTHAVAPFRSHHRMAKANMNGCRITQGTGNNMLKVRFQFLAKGSNIVTVNINLRDLWHNPQTYINNMIEGINETLKHMGEQSDIIVLPKRRELVDHIEKTRLH